MRARSDTASAAGLLASAVALRWSRPDLTAAVAQHIGEAWADDDRTWVAAAGWLVHGRAAIGDGRESASDALANLADRAPGLLDDPSADRLRIEIATLAAGQREPATARQLVEPLLVGADRPADVRADALGVLARCVLEERPPAIDEATRRAEAAWAKVGGVDAEIAAGALALLSAAASRRSGHPDVAVARSADGLARLDGIPSGRAATPSRHIAAALAAEWITALVEAGRADEAREGCDLVASHLSATGRPTRQIALLRLTMARAIAGLTSAGAFEAVEQAAEDASDCDTPDLEGLCLSTLGTLREQAGRLDAALESMRRGVAAQRRDRARSERFRAALGVLSLRSSDRRPEGAAPRDRQQRDVTAASGRHVTRRPISAKVGAAESSSPFAVSSGGPWRTGHWSAESAVPGVSARGRGGRRRLPGPLRVDQVGPTAPASGEPSAFAVERAVPDPAGVAAQHPAAMPHDGAHRGSGGSFARNGHDPVDPLFGPLELIERVDFGGDPVRPDDRGREDDGAHRTSSPPSDDAPVDSTDVLHGRGGGGTIADIPVSPDEASDKGLYDGESWLEAALAGLDRVWGQSPPDLDAPPRRGVQPRPSTVDLPAEGFDSSAGALPAVEGAGDAAPVDAVAGGSSVGAAAAAAAAGTATAPAAAVSPLADTGAADTRAADTGAADTGAADTGAAAAAAGDAVAEPGALQAAEAAWLSPDGVADGGAADPTTDGLATEGLAADDLATEGLAADDLATDGLATDDLATDDPAVSADAVGCVVVVDLIRAGGQVRGGGELLRALAEQLRGRIPRRARLRFDTDDSALSILLPGQARSASTEWMHRTLPVVFAEMADVGLPARLPTSTNLRAAVHDTGGPVGAQLLQRVDLGAPQSPVRLGRQDTSPPPTVRWGVPIREGGGGRRRRADDDALDQLAGGRPAVEVRANRADDDRVAEPRTPGEDADVVPSMSGPDEGAAPAAGRHRQDTRASDAGRGDAGQDSGQEEPAESPPSAGQGERHDPTPGDGHESGALRRAEAGEPVHPDGPTAPADEAFSVEGLGLADLLAGALAAYRGI
jgi:collagen type I/II/III/V/XI/XXIV/XXVII alpha